MPLRGSKKKEIREELASAKELIIKIKKKAIDTSEAEGLYKDAKKAIKNRKFHVAKKGIEEAKKSAKRAYAKGIKKKLEARISKLNENIKKMKAKNLDTSGIEKFLKEAQTSLKEGVKSYKNGLKAARVGLKIAEDTLKKFGTLSTLLAQTGAMLRRIADFNSHLPTLKKFQVRLNEIEEGMLKEKIESNLKKAQKLYEEVTNLKERYNKAFEAITSLEKVVRDADVLGANIKTQSKLDEAKILLSEEKFETACKIAKKSQKEISTFLSGYKDSKYHVDLAEEKIEEVKGWGFSAYEAEKALNLAKEALKNHEFEKATQLSKESKEMAINIRERHKHSLDMINSAKDEVASLKDRGEDLSQYEDIITEAEDEFNRGDYGASDEKIKGIFEFLKRRIR